MTKRSPLRRDVWERSHSVLPTHLRTSSGIHPRPAGKIDTPTFQEPPIASYLPFPTRSPVTNYKHLFIIHRILSQRLCNLHGGSGSKILGKRLRSRTIDAYSSIEAGGLPGHSEAIYSLELIRHRMTIPITQGGADCHRPSPDGPFDTMMTLTGMSESPVEQGNAPAVVGGRDWLLSGSRDKTLRLWQMSCAKPKVVKIFHGGHNGSVLSHFVAKVAGRDGQAERVMAVSGGSDGKICLWDVENGDGSPEKVVQAHADSVLCVRGADERIVSCSKGLSRLQLRSAESALK